MGVFLQKIIHEIKIEKEINIKMIQKIIITKVIMMITDIQIKEKISIMMIEEKNIKIIKINLIQILSPGVSKGIHIIELIIPGPGLDQGQEHILIIIIQIEIKIIMSK
jgi:hypothetical protein